MSTTPISLRAYARRRRCSPEAVSEAVKTGRLKKSVVRNERGQPKISDPDLADQEWDASTDLSRAPGFVKERAEDREAEQPGPTDPPVADSSDHATSAYPGMSLAAATAIEKVWNAKRAELKYRREAAELVPASQVRRALEDVFTSCKTKLLAIPSRVRQQLPDLDGAQVDQIEGLIREALEGLSEEAVL